ncbi:MAG TPA: DUF4340 domain-containing protein, partial [Candidatus Hydrogenedentes bacterium]|nr:DUF4340 domain-containing protein [Candidatus Hydrogenedentota bacterium]
QQEHHKIPPTLIVGAETADAARLSVAFGKMEPIQVNRYARVNDGAVVLISDRSFLRLNRSLRDLRDRRIFSFAPDAVRRIEFARLWDGRGEAPAAFRHSRESGNPANEAPGETPPLGTELGRVAVVRNTAEGPWQVVEPVEAPADQDRVAALLQELPNLTGDHYVDQPEDLSDYGLNPGWARLTLAGDGDAAETLYLGAADLAGDGGLFAKRADQESVCLLDPYFVNFLPLTRTHFRDARLITRPVRGLNALRYVSREDEFILQKDPDLGWRLVSPPADQTDQVAVSTLIGELVRMTALDFPVGAPEDFGLNDPDVALWLGFEGESDMVQIGFVGGPEGRDACFATQDTGAVVLLPEEALAAIRRSSDDLESFELMRFSKEHAVKLAIAIEARQVVIENRAGVWQVALPADHVLQNQSDARLLLDALSPLKAEADLVVPEDLAVYGLDRPVLTVTVEVILPEQPGYVAALGPLFVGAPAHEQPRTRYAMLSGRDGIYLIGQDVLDRVREALRGVRPAPR